MAFSTPQSRWKPREPCGSSRTENPIKIGLAASQLCWQMVRAVHAAPNGLQITNIPVMAAYFKAIHFLWIYLPFVFRCSKYPANSVRHQKNSGSISTTNGLFIIRAYHHYWCRLWGPLASPWATKTWFRLQRIRARLLPQGSRSGLPHQTLPRGGDHRYAVTSARRIMEVI